MLPLCVCNAYAHACAQIPMVKHSGDIEGLRQGELFEFEIVTPERKRPWILASKSDAERQEWIEALQVGQ